MPIDRHVLHEDSPSSAVSGVTDEVFRGDDGSSGVEERVREGDGGEEGGGEEEREGSPGM